jgi:acyl-[acyl-carrier-protein] desaturase
MQADTLAPSDSAPAALSDAALLHELTPVAEQLVERHYATMKPWQPHVYVPWSLGRDYTDGEVWDGRDFPLPDAVRSALFVNLLTEDNLPYYFETINRVFGATGVWRTWSHRWVAEENRHSSAIRDYLHVTRAVDPDLLEAARMAQMGGGEVPQPPTAADGLVYVALQELATRIAHRNTGKLLLEHGKDHPGTQAGYEIMARVAADENFHHLFYRDLVSAALEVDPSGVMAAIERQVEGFQMPGTGIPNFAAHSQAIANVGIYNLEQHHSQILVPVVLRQWAIDRTQGLTDRAEQARDRVMAKIDQIGKIARRLAERARIAAERAQAAGPVALA